jgi:hypothetical protein
VFFGAQARWSIIDQTLQIPNFSMFLRGALEVFGEKEKAKEISLLWAWHGPCSVL